MKHFERLSAEEMEIVLDALPLITLWTGEADGELDETELAWAKKLTQIRQYDTEKNDILEDFYEEAGKDFDERIIRLSASLVATNRRGDLDFRLGRINHIFPKMDHIMALRFYKTLVTFSRSIAKSSGGVLGIGKVKLSEKKAMDLPMIKCP
jgi:hypothetical protein